MSWPYVLYVMKRRWWLALAIVALTVAASLAYTHAQRRLYQASATTFAYPIAQNASDTTNSVGLLTYGNLADTFASLAQSRHYLEQAGGTLGLAPHALTLYTVKAATLPQTTVLQISVIGPDPTTTVRLANRLTRQVGIATSQYFRVFGLQPLDQAPMPLSPVQPKPLQQALYALVASLIAGFALAALSLRVPSSAAGMLGVRRVPGALRVPGVAGVSPNLGGPEEMPEPAPVEPAPSEPSVPELPAPVTLQQSATHNMRRLDDLLPVEDKDAELAGANGHGQ